MNVPKGRKIRISPEEREARRKRGLANAEHAAPYRFQPGHSGNPSGRPKDYDNPDKVMTEAIRRMAPIKVPGDPKGRIWADIAAEGMYKGAAKGSAACFAEIANRLDGKVSDHLKLSANVDVTAAIVDAFRAIRDET